MSIDVESTIRVYEVDGRDLPGGVNKFVQVESHWVYKDRVKLVVDGKRYTVIGRDLEKAIANARNS